PIRASDRRGTAGVEAARRDHRRDGDEDSPAQTGVAGSEGIPVHAAGWSALERVVAELGVAPGAREGGRALPARGAVAAHARIAAAPPRGAVALRASGRRLPRPRRPVQV